MEHMYHMVLRAWDDEMGFMLNHKQVINEILSLYDKYNDIFNHENYHIMEGTGLFDTLGNEIFVGDILSDTQSKSSNIIYEITRDAGGFYITAFARGFKDVHSTTYPFVNDEYKIIGNIYQNKNLIQRGQQWI